MTLSHQYAIDYSWARPDPVAIKAAGFSTVCRYLSRDRTGKTLSADEVRRLHGVGLDILLNFEDGAKRPTAGKAAGMEDATFANRLANSLGAPSEVPIYYSVDSDLSFDAVVHYFDGIKSVAGRRIGVYGGAMLLNGLTDHGFVEFRWETNAKSWNHGAQTRAPHLIQLYSHPAGTPIIAGTDGQSYDTSIIMNTSHGQWYADGRQQQEETDLSWSKWNDLEKIDMVNQVAEEVARRLTGAPNVVTGKPFYPAIGDFTKITITALTDVIKTVPGVAVGDATAIAKAVSDEISKRLAG